MPADVNVPTTGKVRQAWTDWGDLVSSHDAGAFDRWHNRERAQALRAAAGDERWSRDEHRHVRQWLRDRADRIERGEQP